jgi:hypothetical protein
MCTERLLHGSVGRYFGERFVFLRQNKSVRVLSERAGHRTLCDKLETSVTAACEDLVPPLHRLQMKVSDKSELKWKHSR